MMNQKELAKVKRKWLKQCVTFSCGFCNGNGCCDNAEFHEKKLICAIFEDLKKVLV